MSSVAAAKLAVAQAQTSGEVSTTGVTQLEGTFAHNQSVLSPEAKMGELPETKGWLQSDTYLTVMHGNFTAPNVPKGHAPVQGSVMAVITDAHTGFVDSTFIGSKTPSASGMTDVSITEPSVATIARTKNSLGVIVGRLVQSTSPPAGFKSTTRPLVGWSVLIGKGKLPLFTPSSGREAGRTPDVIATLTTGADGRFSVHVKPGKYLIAGVWPNVEQHSTPPPPAGKVCAGEHHVTVRARKRSHVVIACNDGP